MELINIDKWQTMRGLNLTNQITSKTPSKTPSSEKLVVNFLEENAGEWTPKVIARKLKQNYNTIRGVCLKLSKKGIVKRQKVGLCSFYYLKRPYENELLRMKPTVAPLLPEIHNLQLYIEVDAHQLEGYRPEKRFNFDYRSVFGFKRDITVRYGEINNSITVWLGASDNPLTYEDFKHFLTYVEGATGCPVWTQLSKWQVKRFGLNRDIPKYEESPQSTILLSGFAGWFAQAYDKDLYSDVTSEGRKIEHCRRIEIESRNMVNAQTFIESMLGNLTVTQIINLVQRQQTQIDQLTRELRSFTKFFDKRFKEK